MGLVIGFSSLVGFSCDLIFSQLFHGKNYSFFLIRMFFFAIAFPLSLIFLPRIVVFFLIPMAIWGIYYELFMFSNTHFIHTHVKKDNHTSAWGILQFFRAASYTLGPLIAAVLLAREVKISLYGAVTFFSLGLAVFLFFHFRGRRKRAMQTGQVVVPEHHSLKKEIRIWRVLMKRVWPIYIFFCAVAILDATFWTVGTLLSEELKMGGVQVGGLVTSAYMIPSFFSSLIVGKVTRPLGKKRTAFISAIISGALLVLGGIFAEGLWFVGIVLVSSIFSAITWPEIYATFEDYMGRLGVFGDDIVGLQNSSVSLSFIIGPILSGAIAAVIGNQRTFSVVGGLLVAVALLALFIVPRKVLMPQKELAQIGD
jgi:hypothetical protein